ncbi:MAG TPA: response regulator [Opitutaceae bacterium]|nr:response regulator [Opitutaceae bacterium]
MTAKPPSFTPFPDRQALILDDNSAICGLLKTVIERRNYRVLTFGDPAAALQYLAGNTQAVDFAIIDIGLVGMDGVEFARRMREMQPRTVMVFSTGRNLTPEQSDFARSDNALFLPKPFNLGQLDTMLAGVEQRHAVPPRA